MSGDPCSDNCLTTALSSCGNFGSSSFDPTCCKNSTLIAKAVSCIEANCKDDGDIVIDAECSRDGVSFLPPDSTPIQAPTKSAFGSSSSRSVSISTTESSSNSIATSSETSLPNISSSSNLSTGTIAGLSVGVSLLLLALVALLFVSIRIRRRRRKRARSQTNHDFGRFVKDGPFPDHVLTAAHSDSLPTSIETTPFPFLLLHNTTPPQIGEKRREGLLRSNLQSSGSGSDPDPASRRRRSMDAANTPSASGPLQIQAMAERLALLEARERQREQEQEDSELEHPPPTYSSRSAGGRNKEAEGT
ncbi:hypothetical protein C8F01DRAFT_1311939 [Mycena amicta]|nr:hypothetical protein C8F01DRAFT_1311939 [Mycena amicta]